MLNLNNALTLSVEQNSIIQGFGALTADHWRRNETKLRKAIRESLKSIQHMSLMTATSPTPVHLPV